MKPLDAREGFCYAFAASDEFNSPQSNPLTTQSEQRLTQPDGKDSGALLASVGTLARECEETAERWRKKSGVDERGWTMLIFVP